MRVLLDENLPADLVAGLVGHEASTVSAEGWQGITNGELLRQMAGRFDALLTMDRNLQQQQSLTGLAFGILLIRAPSNRLVHLQLVLPAILDTLRQLQPGEFRSVGA